MPSKSSNQFEGNRKPSRKPSSTEGASRLKGSNQKRRTPYNPTRNAHKLYMWQAATSFGLICVGITTFCGLQAMSVALLLQGRVDQPVATTASGFASNLLLDMLVKLIKKLKLDWQGQVNQHSENRAHHANS
jgi:hypothetical protein